MTLQTSVQYVMGAGVPGDLADNGPLRAQPYTLVSALASYNIVGATAYTLVSQATVNNVNVQIAAAGNTGTTGVFVGFLVNPKAYASLGTSSGTLNPTLTLPNQTIGELATMGSFFATLPAAANVGDLVVFDNTTGALSTIAPSAGLPSGTSFAYARVDRFTNAGAGVGVITLTPTLRIPT